MRVHGAWLRQMSTLAVLCGVLGGAVSCGKAPVAPIVGPFGAGILPVMSEADYNFVTVGGTYQSAWIDPYKYAMATGSFAGSVQRVMTVHMVSPAGRGRVVQLVEAYPILALPHGRGGTGWTILESSCLALNIAVRANVRAVRAGAVMVVRAAVIVAVRDRARTPTKGEGWIQAGIGELARERVDPQAFAPPQRIWLDATNAGVEFGRLVEPGAQKCVVANPELGLRGFARSRGA